VTWTNAGEQPHTATDRGGTFDTKPIAPGASAEVTLSTPGTYFHFCRINPAKMNGILTVEPGADEPRTTRVQAVDPGFTGDKHRFDPDELTMAAGTQARHRPAPERSTAARSTSPSNPRTPRWRPAARSPSPTAARPPTP
jgi:hypothetical protein